MNTKNQHILSAEGGVMDRVDNAHALLHVVDKYVGRDSRTAEWVRKMLQEGHEPQTLAKALADLEPPHDRRGKHYE